MNKSTIALLIILVIALIGAYKTVNAGEVSVKILTNTYITDNEQYSRSSSNGIQLSYTPQESFYFFLSKDSVRVCPNGCAFTYKMDGVGIGNKIRLTKSISLFSQVGYYKVSNDYGEKNFKFNEALGYYLNDRFGDAVGNGVQKFEAYSVINDNTFGGSIGLEMDHKVTKNFSVTSTLSYRLLKIKETIQGWQSVEKGYWWETGMSRDYSSINFGIGAHYTF